MSTQKLFTPEEIAARGPSAAPFLRLPDRRAAFADRAARLRALAPGHAMQGYLEFVALVADAQQRMLDDMPALRLPRPDAVARGREQGVPPLDFRSHARDPGWADVLRRILRMVMVDAEGTALEVVRRLEGSRDELYEAQASKLLGGVMRGLDRGAAPLIGAGLQTYFAHLAISLGEAAFAPLDATSVCPCCYGLPTASIVRVGGDVSGHRFLHCSLCGAQWHYVRLKCVQCGGSKAISYAGLDDGSGRPQKPAMAAEICDECGHYLKIAYMDRDPQVEPCADDLATLALDLLVVDTDKTPVGLNFMLVHDDPAPD